MKVRRKKVMILLEGTMAQLSDDSFDYPFSCDDSLRNKFALSGGGQRELLSLLVK